MKRIADFRGSVPADQRHVKYSQGGQMQHGEPHPVKPDPGNVGYNAGHLEAGAQQQYAQLIRQGYNRKQAVHMVMAALGYLHHHDQSGPVKYKGGLGSVPPADRPPTSSYPPDSSREPAGPGYPDFPREEADVAYLEVAQDDDEPVLKESSVRSGFNRRGTTRRHPVDNRRKSYY
jgi:hypothetical protein